MFTVSLSLCLSLPAGSVLLQDEAKSGYSGGDVAINMDGEGHRYQQQVQLIEDQVRTYAKAVGLMLY